jgi:Tfp pilus assembly protein PilV
MLIEVMVGAVILAVASIAIFNGLDGAQSTGATNKARSVQATLAQQDIERMRAIPITSLSNYRLTRTVDVAGVDYTVVSRTDWVRDATGVVGCTTDETQAQYLKLSSTVTSPASGDRPVKETGLLSPAAGQLSTTAGTATVRLTNRLGQPVSGVAVGLSGPASFSDTTDTLGCAVFGYIPAGSYTAQVAGLVTPTSSVPAQQPLEVYAGKASMGQMQVELPASLRANFVPPLNNTFTPAANVLWDKITVKNAGLPGGRKIFTRASAATSVDATELFPFTDGVGVYAGSCTANDPSTYITNYFQPNGRGYVVNNPGDALRPVDVEMATMRVNVTRQTVSPPTAPTTATVPSFTAASVRLIPFDGTCPGFFASATFAARTTPWVFDIAVPFGQYHVCASVTGRQFGTATSHPTSGAGPVSRKYTTTASATTNPTNPADPSFSPVTPPNRYNRQITVTTPTATSGTC